MKMATYTIIAGIVIVCFGCWLYNRPPQKRKYLVTYEASLKAGGWTHGEVFTTTEQLDSNSLYSIREWIRSNRTDITENVCIMNIVKLDK